MNYQEQIEVENIDLMDAVRSVDREGEYIGLFAQKATRAMGRRINLNTKFIRLSNKLDTFHKAA